MKKPCCGLRVKTVETWISLEMSEEHKVKDGGSHIWTNTTVSKAAAQSVWVIDSEAT